VTRADEFRGRVWKVTLWIKAWRPLWVWRGAYPDPLPKWWSGKPMFYYWKVGPVEIRHFCHVKKSRGASSSGPCSPPQNY